MGFSSLIHLLAQWFVYALIARAVLSWFPAPTGLVSQFASFVHTITEPVLAPMRRVIPPLRIGGGMLDLTPLVCILLLRVVLPQILP